MKIEHFTVAEAHTAIPELVRLLVDAVESGASIGFLPPLAEEEAHVYWSQVVAEVAAGRRVLLAAVEEGQIVGSAQLELATKPNALHRAEVQKLMVHTRARNRGIGQALMTAVEDAARAADRTLLVLDTLQGHAAERLYIKHGYTRVGDIPQYARYADGTLQPTVVFYRLL